jgi:hypothetical protein
MNNLKIKVIENCISQQYVDFINNELNPQSIPWNYGDDVAYAAKTDKLLQMGFCNNVYNINTIINTSYWFLYPLLLETANKNNFFVERLIRIRIGGYINRNIAQTHSAHIDFDEPHLVALYYPHDTDGDTVFYDAKENGNEIFRVSPKKGSIVFFDGSIYHASSNPVKHNFRMTINFNFVGKWPL